MNCIDYLLNLEIATIFKLLGLFLNQLKPIRNLKVQSLTTKPIFLPNFHFYANFFESKKFKFCQIEENKKLKNGYQKRSQASITKLKDKQTFAEVSMRQ